MKQLKIIGPLVIAVISFAAAAGVAQADQATSPTGTTWTGTSHFKSKGHISWANAISGVISCNHTGVTDINAHGATIKLSVTETRWFNCTNSWHVTTEQTGEWTLEHTSGYNGTVVSSGTLIKTTRFLVPCNYETNNTHLGTLTGGSPAILDIEASMPIAAGSSELCGSSNAAMEGTLEVASPSPVYVDS